MTNREMVLLAAAILFASTTLGLAFNAMRPSPHAYGMAHGHPHGQSKKDWKKHGEQMFLKADTDKDGALSKDEMIAGFTAKVEGMFTKLDKDADGKLTREEMEEGRKLMKKRFMENPDRGPDARRPANRMPA